MLLVLWNSTAVPVCSIGVEVNTETSQQVLREHVEYQCVYVSIVRVRHGLNTRYRLILNAVQFVTTAERSSVMRVPHVVLRGDQSPTPE